MSERYWAVLHPADVAVGDEVVVIECGEPEPAAPALAPWIKPAD